jgi:hypothetical protein
MKISDSQADNSKTRRKWNRKRNTRIQNEKILAQEAEEESRRKNLLKEELLYIMSQTRTHPQSLQM